MSPQYHRTDRVVRIAHLPCRSRVGDHGGHKRIRHPLYLFSHNLLAAGGIEADRYAATTRRAHKDLVSARGSSIALVHYARHQHDLFCRDAARIGFGLPRAS